MEEEFSASSSSPSFEFTSPSESVLWFWDAREGELGEIGWGEGGRTGAALAFFFLYKAL